MGASVAVSRRRCAVALAVNVLVVVLELWALGYGIAYRGLLENFIYYTSCSNLIGAAACACCAVAQARQLRRGQFSDMLVSRALSWVKFAASSCLLMTMLVVLVVLVPMLNSIGQPGVYLMLVEGIKPIVHLIAPLLVIGSYLAFEADRSMTVRQSLVGLAPTIAYAAVAYPCNITRVWDGPYPFLQVWNMPVWQSVLWFIALLVLAFSLSQVVRLLGRVIGPKGSA